MKLIVLVNYQHERKKEKNIQLASAMSLIASVSYIQIGEKYEK